MSKRAGAVDRWPRLSCFSLTPTERLRSSLLNQSRGPLVGISTKSGFFRYNNWVCYTLFRELDVEGHSCRVRRVYVHDVRDTL